MSLLLLLMILGGDCAQPEGPFDPCGIGQSDLPSSCARGVSLLSWLVEHPYKCLPGVQGGAASPISMQAAHFSVPCWAGHEG